MKNTSGSLNVLFLKKCWRAIELTCFKGEGVNKPERIGFVAVLYPTIIGNAEATALVLRIITGIQKYLKYVATWYHIKVIFHFGEKGGLFNK